MFRDPPSSTLEHFSTLQLLIEAIQIFTRYATPSYGFLIIDSEINNQGQYSTRYLITRLANAIETAAGTMMDSMMNILMYKPSA